MTAPLLTHPADRGWDLLGTGTRPVLSQYQRIATLVRSQADAELAATLAEPHLDAEGRPLGWRSTLGGALVPASAQAESMLAERLSRIEALADRLDGQGDAGRMAAFSLRSALVRPDGAASVFMDASAGKPVLVHWGMALPGQARPALPGQAAMAAVATGTASATVGAAAASVPAAGAPSRADFGWWPWLLPGALTAALALLVLLLLQPPPVETRVVVPPRPAALDPGIGLGDTLAVLDGALGEARAAEQRYLATCTAAPATASPQSPETALSQRLPPTPDADRGPAPPGPAADAPAPAPVADGPEPVAVVPPVGMAPETAPRPPVKATPPPTVAVETPKRPKRVNPLSLPEPPLPPPVATQPAPAPAPAPAAAPASGSKRAACNPTWPPGRAPRMVFVVDGSGSMADPIRGAGSRMQAAKRSISQVVRGLHSDVRVGMVSFSDCNATSNSRYYSASERGQLVGRVNAINPGRATSLANSISRAGAMATRRTETVLVVVSDGKDTCGRDPCAAARAVRRSKPNVRINVIDLSGGEARAVLSCVASAGGGRVYSPASAGQMAAQVQRATGLPDASGC